MEWKEQEVKSNIRRTILETLYTLMDDYLMKRKNIYTSDFAPKGVEMPPPPKTHIN